MNLKNVLKGMFGFECERISAPQKRRWCYSTMDYTALLNLFDIKPFEGDEYFIEGFESQKFTDLELDFDFSHRESHLLEAYGTEDYSDSQYQIIVDALLRCVTLIEKFNEYNKGKDIIYAQTVYESEIGLSEGWKLFNVNGKWKLCVNYRLI